MFACQSFSCACVFVDRDIFGGEGYCCWLAAEHFVRSEIVLVFVGLRKSDGFSGVYLGGFILNLVFGNRVVRMQMQS